MTLKQRIAAFLNPEQVKVNPAYQGLISYSNASQLMQMPRNYKAFSKEGYENDTVYKCVSYISRNGAAIAPKLYTDRSMQKEIESHPLLDKLHDPNSEQSGMAYREACLAYKLLAGNNYQYAIRKGNGPPDELWTLRPDYMQIQASKPRGIVGYKYEFMEELIAPQNIGHTKYWNPNNEVYGISPIEIASILIDMQTFTRKWDLALIQNSARPSGAWTTPVPLAKNVREALQNKLKEMFGGMRNAGVPPVLDAGLTWQSMGLPPAEMDWLKSIQYNAVLIANIFNMPPQLIGDTTSSTYANVEEAKVASYTEAIFPDLDDLYALWNTWLLPMYPDLKGAYLYYDKDSIEVIQKTIQAQKTAEAQRAVNAWLNGACTLNEARSLQGLPEDPNGNVYRIGLVIIPAERLDEFAEKALQVTPAPAAPEQAGLPPGTIVEADKTPPAQDDTNEEDQKDGDNKKPLKGLSPLALPQYRTPDRRMKALNLSTTEQKQAHAEAMETTRKRWESKLEKDLQKYFKTQQGIITDAIDKAALPSTAILRVETAIKRTKDDGEKILSSFYQGVVSDVASQIKKQIQQAQKGVKPDETKISPANLSQNVQVFLDTFGADTLEYLESLAGTRISGITDTTLDSIRSQLLQGVAAGESIPELSKRIAGLYLSQIIPNRSAVISRTETTASSNYGSIQGAKQSGLKLTKVWLATGDNRTRPDHVDADGQEVGIDEPFQVGTSEMQFPGDPAGAADEVVGCRCTTYYNTIEDANGVPLEEVQREIDEEEGKGMQPIAISRKQRRAEYKRYMQELLG